MTHQLQPFHGVVAVDLLDIELAHEVDSLLRDHLARYHDREAGRIRNDKTGRDQFRTALQTSIDLGIRKTDKLATRRVVGGIKAAPDIAFIGLLAGIAPETVVEAREVRQVRHVGHQALDPCVECLASVRATLSEGAIDLSTNFGQHPNEIRNVAAGVVDVGLEQYGITRGLVDLDSVAICEDPLELGPVEARRAAHQRHARGIEAELVVLQTATCNRPIGPRREEVDKAAFAVLRRHHVDAHPATAQPFLFAHERAILADDHVRNTIEENRARAHRAW